MTDKPDTNPEDVIATGTQPGQKAEGKTFSQEEVNRIMGETRRDAVNSTTKKLLQDLGFEDAEALKTSLGKLKQLEEANKSDSEKLQEAVELAKKQLAETQVELQRTVQENAETQIRSDIIAEASKRNFIDPLDAYRTINLSAIRRDAEAGKTEGIEGALDELAKEKPYLLRQENTPRIAPTNPGKTEPQGETEAQRRSRLFGGGQTPLGTAQGGGVWWEPKQ